MRSTDSVSRPVVLLIGHAGIPTGFARVLDEIATRLAAVFEVHLLGITLPSAGTSLARYTLHPNPGALHGAETLLQLVRELQPAACLILDEPWVCAQRIATLRTCHPRPRVLCYCAADEAQLLPHDILPALALADCLIAFTAAAEALLAGAFRQAAIAAPPIAVIAHGVDTDTFRPLSRIESRLALFPGEPNPDGAFIVLNANRNQVFKRIDLTLEGFALFAREAPASVKLCLHMASRPAGPREIPLMDRLGIRDRIIFASPPGKSHPQFTDAQLNLLYNACDVGINTSDKEGWGLVSFEHAATGAAQIVPGLPALRELWKDAALLLPVGDRASTQMPGRVAPTVTAHDVAQALDLLYRDAKAREQWSAAALRNARRPEYRWEAIGDRWISLITTALGVES